MIYLGDENSLQGRTQAHKHEIDASTGGYLAEGQTGITGGNVGEVLTATATDIPVWSAIPSVSGAYTLEGSDVQGGYVASLNVATSDKDVYLIYYNVTSDTLATNCKVSIRVNSVSSGYRVMRYSQYSAGDYTDFDGSVSEGYLEADGNTKTSEGMVFLMKADPNNQGTGVLYRGLNAVIQSHGIDYLNYSAGSCSSIGTSAITDIDILYDAGNITGSMTVLSLDY